MLLNKVLLPALIVFCSTGMLKAQEATDSINQAEARRVKYLQGLRKVSSDKELKYADSVTEAKNIFSSDIRFLSQDYKKFGHYMEFNKVIDDSHFKMTADVYVDSAFVIRAKVARPATKVEEEKNIADFKKVLDEETKSPRGQEREKIFASQLGKPAPLFSVVDVDNVKYDLNQLKGKVVVLNFWFTACAPCKKEIPDLNAMVEKYKGKDVVFLAFEVNSYEPAKLKAITEKFFKYTMIPSTRKEGDVASKYQIKAYPTSYVIDQSGIVRFAVAYNPFRLPEMDKTIEGLLMKKPVATKKASK
ncbi:TlpA family protein disulfide reductase [Solitalea koreensis]|uniref:Thiol-disulfide isomerase or thioredoxin n=1 Tax=Solitalea koreensis TaxID=543615 RepID=A0A521C2N9_9SPHI|nr:TlpA disulfide reductase family protein [Solitalea koreensis]SMO53756.1 Thiol-disulfide isomerase or thioredoxin [Solitalea koreensis]